ncbi:hypothetical protein M426DRAFT_15694 [Hypoxylon sp. CI-4A]|nr:hypothetical protein M426DRAFT_15694 [Hypoxylon sp. CI-4A]
MTGVFSRHGELGIVREGPILSETEASKILIKAHAWATYRHQSVRRQAARYPGPDVVLDHIPYPIITEQDVAGIVVAVGSSASSKFKVEDDIFGFSLNYSLQDYVTLNAVVAAARLLSSLAYRGATVFLLCISACAFALYGKDYLASLFPSLISTNQDNLEICLGLGR